MAECLDSEETRHSPKTYRLGSGRFLPSVRPFGHYRLGKAEEASTQPRWTTFENRLRINRSEVGDDTPRAVGRTADLRIGWFLMRRHRRWARGPRRARVFPVRQGHPLGFRRAARDSSLHLYGGRVGERPSWAAVAASSRLAKS